MNQARFEILGGRTYINNVDEFIRSVRDFGNKNGVCIQILNAQMICGIVHLKSSILHALRAESETRMSTKSIEMEILLYAAGERQLIHAIPKMGIKSGKSSVAVVFLYKNNEKELLLDLRSKFLQEFQFQKDFTVFHPSLTKLLDWGFSEEELNTILNDEYENLILEKVALVDVIK